SFNLTFIISVFNFRSDFLFHRFSWINGLQKARNESDEEINPRPLVRVAQASRLPRPSEERTSACCRLCERIPKSLIALSHRRASCPPLTRRPSLRSHAALPRFGLSQSLLFRQ